jgi:hypothetical protein
MKGLANWARAVNTLTWAEMMRLCDTLVDQYDAAAAAGWTKDTAMLKKLAQSTLCRMGSDTQPPCSWQRPGAAIARSSP